MLKVTLAGNVGADATIRETGDNIAINFNVAHSESYKNKEGVLTEKTTWFSCTVWRKKGQSTELAKWLTKGTFVALTGKPEAKIYYSLGSEAKIDNTVIVYDLEFKSTRPKNAGDNSSQSNNTTSQGTQATEPESGSMRVNEDDLPF